jgi:hypothetical protein
MAIITFAWSQSTRHHSFPWTHKKAVGVGSTPQSQCRSVQRGDTALHLRLSQAGQYRLLACCASDRVTGWLIILLSCISCPTVCLQSRMLKSHWMSCLNTVSPLATGECFQLTTSVLSRGSLCGGHFDRHLRATVGRDLNVCANAPNLRWGMW